MKSYATAEERRAYYEGREDGGDEAKARPRSFVVVFEDYTDDDEPSRAVGAAA